MLVDKLRRPLFFVAAAALVLASLVPVVLEHQAHAYNLVANRSIKLTSSKASDNPVTYTVSFDAATTATIKSLAVDFCSTTPIIGDTCTAPAGFSVGTPTVANQSGITGYTAASLNTGRTLTLTKAAGTALTAGNTVSFDLTTATNPSASNTTFYARILTFPNDTGANSAANYTDTTPGAATDAGGVALSTDNQLTITAKVQERLTFCVYTGANCGAGGSTLTLGDANGVLDPATQYTNNNAKFDLAHNAASGVKVRMKGGTLKRTPGCADGTGQPCSIDPTGASAVAGAVGGEQFGLRVTSSGAPLTATAPYNGASNNYAFDDNNSTGTQSTYGQEIASSSASSTKTGTLEFVGNIANTTESGIYTTTLTYIATGIY